ncbi:P2R1A-PPP2R2A-interacting phosphatase regulator 1-like [Tamandua tetradactyla]|uniref:P2R1A-PPP2R2A-interacting phosphatase regulator 1-like n=1 Tax=Tamandua tetradactyla TaxID=48850 RepID=UPI00405426B1
MSIPTRLPPLFFPSFSSHTTDLSLYEREPESLENFKPSSGFFLNTSMTQNNMEADLELLLNSVTTDDNVPKRSNSTPLINGLADNSQVSQDDTLRTRRHRATLMNQRCLLLPLPPIQAATSRLHLTKQEEGMDLINRETMRERVLYCITIQSVIQINQSWKESLNLSDNESKKSSSSKYMVSIPRFFQGTTNMLTSDTTKLSDMNV